MRFLLTAASITEKLPRFLRRHKLMRLWMKLTGEPAIQLVRIRDDSFGYADMSDGFLRLIPIEGSYDADFFVIADAILGGGGCFFDVGANYGLLSFGLAGRHGSNIDFHLFEPNLKLVDIIARSQRRYERMRCRVNPVAVSDCAGEVRFSIVEEQTGVSHISTADEAGGIVVPAITLDGYIAETGIDSVDLLKIDVEGFELTVLRGAEASLRSRRIKAVYFEYIEKQLIRVGRPEALIEYLGGLGFVTCFCRPDDFARRQPPTHTIRAGMPGHGLGLLPLAGLAPPVDDRFAGLTRRTFGTIGMKLSVIICTHNPRTDYFARVLAALADQTLAHDDWELLIIDNCSKDPVAGRFDTTWKAGVQIVREEALGLTPARLRGIREATGELLVFVDDDNVLDPDFLEVAQRIAVERPWLGSWSGQCRPEFETEPEAWTRRYWGNLAIREFDRDVWSNLPRLADTMPCGAGLCVRKDVAAEYVRLHEQGLRRFQFDRTGDSLISGGDNDLAACATSLGLGVGLVGALGLEHLIPEFRLQADYLTRLAEGIHFSSVILDREWGLETPPRSLAGKWIDWLKSSSKRSPHRQILQAAYRGRDRALAMLANRELDKFT
jgi:FkbM family methyltransferase